MRAYLDKIEGEKAELRLGEDESTRLVVPTSELPAGAREGDVLTMRLERDERATAADADANDARRRALVERSKDEPF